jgi:hypothetical protein
LRRRRPTPGAQAPEKADFNRRNSLRPTTGLRRPGDLICVGEGRRPARKRLRRPISIGATASGRRPACADREISFASAKADARRASALEGRFQSAGRPPASGRPDASNEFDLKGPSADGRPAPTGRFASAKADARRASALEGRFQSAGRPPASGRPDASNEFDLRGASGPRPARKRLGQQPAPTGRSHLRRRRPTPGAQAPWKADFNRRNSLRPTTGLRRLKERKMPTSWLSHRRAPRVHRFGPELIGRATLIGQRETSGQTGSGSPPDNSIIPGEDPTACGRLPRARPLPPSRTERDGFVRRAGKAGFPCPSDIPGLELVEGLK